VRLHACGPVQAGMHPGPRAERQCLKVALIADCNNWRTQELSDFIGNNWEKQAIVSFHLKNPLEGYRRPTFMMLDAGIVAVSSVQRMVCTVWWSLHRALQQHPADSAAGYITPKDILAKRQQEIHAEGDRK
jgi:hypothetical protein